MSLHVCVYLRARLPACVSATGTGQCLITANIQGAAAASSNCLVALFTHWRIYQSSSSPSPSSSSSSMAVVVIAWRFFVVAPTSFSTSRCYCCCWFGNGFCVWNVHFRLLLPSASSAVAAAAAAAEQASPGLSGQMGTAFKFRKAAATLSLPQTHIYTLTHTRPHLHLPSGINTFVYVEILQQRYVHLYVCLCVSAPCVVDLYICIQYVFICCRCLLCIHPEQQRKQTPMPTPTHTFMAITILRNLQLKNTDVSMCIDLSSGIGTRNRRNINHFV